MEPNLMEFVTPETLRRLAGQRSFERGEEYAEIGAVGSLQWDDASIRAHAAARTGGKPLTLAHTPRIDPGPSRR